MQVLSFSHTIVATAAARVFPEGAKLPDGMFLNHPAGTVLELDDDEAKRLVEDGIVERYVRSEHGEDQRIIIANVTGYRNTAAVKRAEARVGITTHQAA